MLIVGISFIKICITLKVVNIVGGPIFKILCYKIQSYK